MQLMGIRSVVENFRLYKEQLRYTGGINHLMGFTSTSVVVQRGKRYVGKTSYTFQKRLAAAIEFVIAYSDKPLKFSVLAGLLISFFSILSGVLIFLLAWNDITKVSGWASIMVSFYFIGGLIIANLGVLGHYIGKVFDETKRRPLYLIESKTFEK